MVWSKIGSYLRTGKTFFNNFFYILKGMIRAIQNAFTFCYNLYSSGDMTSSIFDQIIDIYIYTLFQNFRATPKIEVFCIFMRFLALKPIASYFSGPTTVESPKSTQKNQEKI